MNFYAAIAEFCAYPKTDDLTLDFFNFLESNHPDIWERLSQFYSDDEYYDEVGHSFRTARYGWDEIAEKGKFHLFLPAIKSTWLEITSQDYGICDSCKKETDLDIEHRLIASYEFAPVVKYYEAFEMDGSVNVERIMCRECAIKKYKMLNGTTKDGDDIVNAEQLRCVV